MKGSENIKVAFPSVKSKFRMVSPGKPADVQLQVSKNILQQKPESRKRGQVSVTAFPGRMGLRWGGGITKR